MHKVDDGTGGAAGLTTTTTVYTYGSGTVDPTKGPVNLTLPAFNFGDGSSTTQVATVDIGPTTQFAAANNVNSVTQDGVPYGTKSSLSIDSNGFVSANFSNGSTKKIFQIPLATFNAEDNLQEATGDVYTQTTSSGSYYLRQVNTGGAGTIVTSSLENSNVDIANEFSKMIVTQQAYSANSKVISTAETMLNSLLQIQT